LRFYWLLNDLNPFFSRFCLDKLFEVYAMSDIPARDLSTPAVTTGYLGPIQPKPVAGRGVTGPLDRSLPWVIELRVVGTASTLQARLQDEMIIGRRDADQGIYPEIDLSEFQSASLGVSRRHAQILIKDDRLYIRDLGSTNGTFVNGILCEPQKDQRLRHGDEVMLGRLRLQVLFAVVPKQESHAQPALQPGQRAPQPLLSGQQQHVLIIEDDEEVGNVFALALEQAGYRVTVTHDVASGLAAYANDAPDAIILDLLLPDMNGLELLRYLRRQRSQRHIPMLVVSGQSANYKRQQALEAGADVFLGKPLAVDDLLQAVGIALQTTG
jgi:CheY-like chemotaxis protein